MEILRKLRHWLFHRPRKWIFFKNEGYKTSWQLADIPVKQLDFELFEVSYYVGESWVRVDTCGHNRCIHVAYRRRRLWRPELVKQVMNRDMYYKYEEEGALPAPGAMNDTDEYVTYLTDICKKHHRFFVARDPYHPYMNDKSLCDLCLLETSPHTKEGQ